MRRQTKEFIHRFRAQSFASAQDVPEQVFEAEMELALGYLSAMPKVILWLVNGLGGRTECKSYDQVAAEVGITPDQVKEFIRLAERELESRIELGLQAFRLGANNPSLNREVSSLHLQYHETGTECERVGVHFLGQAVQETRLSLLGKGLSSHYIQDLEARLQGMGLRLGLKYPDWAPPAAG